MGTCWCSEFDEGDEDVSSDEGYYDGTPVKYPPGVAPTSFNVTWTPPPRPIVMAVKDDFSVSTAASPEEFEEAAEEVREKTLAKEDLKTRSDRPVGRLRKEAAAEWKVNNNGVTTPPKKPVIYNQMKVTPPPVVLPTLLKASREAPAEKTSAAERGFGEDASGARVTCSKGAAVDRAIKSVKECIECGEDFMKKAQVFEDLLDDLLRRLKEAEEKMKDPRSAGSMTLSEAFEILEVPMGCQDLNQLRKAWQSICLKYHPDKQPADLDAESAAMWTAKFRDGMEAFQVVQQFVQPKSFQ